jgi:hypothetical protein
VIAVPLRELHLDEAGIMAHLEIRYMVRITLASFAAVQAKV